MRQRANWIVGWVTIGSGLLFAVLVRDLSWVERGAWMVLAAGVGWLLGEAGWHPLLSQTKVRRG